MPGENNNPNAAKQTPTDGPPADRAHFSETPADDSVEVNVTPDGMEAYGRIILGAPEGKRVMLEDVSKALLEAGVTYGADIQALRGLIYNPGQSDWVRLAAGSPPINGKDAEIQLHFRTSVTGAARIDEHDRVNFWELDLFEVCTKGQLLATKTPPTKGEPGISVFGRAVEPKPGKDKPFPRARGVEMGKDGLALYSALDGHVAFPEGQIVASDTLVIPRDVDMSTGNITYAGNVVVRGTVFGSMTIKAGKNIEVYGLVEGAVLEAGGNITLHSGVQASGSGHVMAKGSVSARYIERANVMADGFVQADSIMHSTVESGQYIVASGIKGVIMGGKSAALTSINAKNVGAISGVATELELGMPPQRRARHKFLQSEIARVQLETEKLKHLLRLLGTAYMPGEPQQRTDAREKAVVSLQEDISLMPRLLEEFGELCTEIEMIREGRVNVSGTAHKGVNVIIGSMNYNVTKDIDYVTFKIDGASGRVEASRYEQSKDPGRRGKP